jgi:hypothetical protein
MATRGVIQHRRTARRACGALALGALMLGCGGGEATSYARGRTLAPAGLSPSDEAAVDRAALGAAFTLGPDLVLLLDPVRLPRTGGIVGGDPVPPALSKALHERGIVHGTCQPPRDDSRDVPVCNARAAGYVVRFSDVFRLAPDSVEVHLLARAYRTAPTQLVEALSFEKVYQIVGSGGRWRVAREARVP